MTFILLLILAAAWIAGGIACCRTGKLRWLLGPALLTFLCLMQRSSHNWRQRVLTGLSTSELEALRSEIVRLQARSTEQSQ